MKIEKLQTFLTCVNSKTFYEAADRLFTTPSTVTKHILSLEQEFGVDLFIRSPHGILLTEEGKKRVHIINNIVSSMNELNSMNDASKTKEKNTLSIYSMPLSKRFQLDNLLHAFSHSYPQIEISLQETSSVVNQLLSHKFNIGIVHYAPYMDDHLEYIKFPTAKLGIVISKQHHLSHRKKISIKEVSNEHFIDTSQGIGRKNNQYLFNSYGLTYAPEQVLPTEDAMFVYTIDHSDCMFITTSILFGFFNTKSLVFIPLEENIFMYEALAKDDTTRLHGNEKIFWEFSKNYFSVSEKPHSIFTMPETI